MDAGALVWAAVVAVVGAAAVALARRLARRLHAWGETVVTELREIARIPAEVSALVSAVAALVSELHAAKRRLDELETAFAALDLTPDHVTMTMLATDPHRDREGVNA